MQIKLGKQSMLGWDTYAFSIMMAELPMSLTSYEMQREADSAGALTRHRLDTAP